MLKDTVLIILNYKRPANIAKLINKFKGKLPILIINNNPDIKMLNVTTADFTGTYKDKYIKFQTKNSTYELTEL